MTTVLLRRRNLRTWDSPGYMEIRFNMEVVIMTGLLASSSDGLPLLTTWTQRKTNPTGYLSRTKITKRDAFKYLNKILPERKLIQISITLMRLINSIVS